MDTRPDKGALWENFLVAERMKQNSYKFTLAKPYFWRTTQKQEVDYVEEKSQQLFGFEFKWNPKKKPKLPKTFMDTYQAIGEVITRDNFRSFVVIEE